MTLPNAYAIKVRPTAVGVNFIDIYFRTGLYPMPMPYVPNTEGVGIVEEVGEPFAEAIEALAGKTFARPRRFSPSHRH